MTQNELDLLHGFLHDTLEESDFARLQLLLRPDAEARRMLRSLSAVDTGLMQHAAINPQTLRLLSPSHESFANRVLNARRSFSSQFAETGAHAQLDQGIALTQEFARRQFDLEDHRREDDRHAIAGGALGALERAAAPVGEILPDDSPLIGRGLHG